MIPSFSNACYSGSLMICQNKFSSTCWLLGVWIVNESRVIVMVNTIKTRSERTEPAETFCGLFLLDLNTGVKEIVNISKPKNQLNTD